MGMIADQLKARLDEMHARHDQTLQECKDARDAAWDAYHKQSAALDALIDELA